MKWLFIILGASLIPIWRDSLTLESRNLWQYWFDVHQQKYYDLHIPYSQAVVEAQEAWHRRTND